MNRYHRKWLQIFRQRENTFLRRVEFRDGDHEHGKRYETMRKAARRLNALRMRHAWNRPWILLDDRGDLKRDLRKEPIDTHAVRDCEHFKMRKEDS